MSGSSKKTRGAVSRSKRATRRGVTPGRTDPPQGASGRPVQELARLKAIGGRYDPEALRQSKRSQRERGCWVYIPAQELLKAGISLFAPAPRYRVWGRKRGSILVRVYKEGEGEE